MATPKALFPDGHDFYVDDGEFIQDTAETHLENMLKDITLTGGVANGLTPTAIVDAVEVIAGDAYDEATRALIRKTGTSSVAVGGGDLNSFVVIENVATYDLLENHPVRSGSSAYRRLLQVATLKVEAAPTSTQVRLCKITAVNPGNPPTINTDPPNRDILNLGIGTSGGSVANPYVVVANDGSGDHADLASAVAALPSSGGMIKVKAGTYDLAAVVTVNKSNVRIEGAGASTLFRVDGSAISHGIAIDGSGVGGIEKVSIEQCAFDWTGGDPGAGQDNMAIRIVSCTEPMVLRCTFRDTQGVTNPKGIKSENGVQRGKIADCHFDSLNKGILLNASATGSDLVVSGCTGEGLRFGIHADLNYDRCAVNHCIFVGDGNAASRGILIDQTDDDWSISGCVISGFNVGVLFDGIGVAVVGNCIVGNTTGVSFSTNSNDAVGAGNNLRNNTTPIVNTGDGGNITTPNIT